VGKSEGQLVTSFWPPKPKTASEIQADTAADERCAQVLRRPFHAKPSTPLARQFDALIARAACEAADNQQFCEFLERDRVPVSVAPATWGIRRWSDAMKDKKTQAKLRSFKRRFK
jgi:hypothetical protein